MTMINFVQRQGLRLCEPVYLVPMIDFVQHQGLRLVTMMDFVQRQGLGRSPLLLHLPTTLPTWTPAGGSTQKRKTDTGEPDWIDQPCQ